MDFGVFQENSCHMNKKIYIDLQGFRIISNDFGSVFLLLYRHFFLQKSVEIVIY